MKKEPTKNTLRTRRALLSALLLCGALLSFAAHAAPPQEQVADDSGFVQIALPPGGEVQIENRRGGVWVEVWAEEYVSFAVETGQAAPAPPNPRRGKSRTPKAKPAPRRSSPARVERSETLLLISVPRASAPNSPGVELRVRVPASSRLKILTSEGVVVVNGVPAALDAQSISGDLSLSLAARPDAAVTAQSLNGTVTLGEGLDAPPGAAGRVLRQKFQARWGDGSRRVNLFSGRGRVSLDALAAPPRRDDSARPPRRVPADDSDVGGDSGERPPTLPGSSNSAARPAPQAAETPQEVDEDEVVRVESDLVTLNVSVVERSSGRGLTGLVREDFRLAEDGVEQQIAHFETANAPFDLLLLIDLSGSTAKVTDIIRAAARRFVAATRAQDRVGVVAFSGVTSVVSPLTVDRRALDSAVSAMQPPQGDTRLYDALDFAMNYMERESTPARRRAVILLSDGLDSTMPNVTGTGSAKSYEEVRDRAQEFDGVLYTIWTDTEEYEAFSPLDIQPETFDLARERTQKLAEAGGGLFYEVERLEDLAGAYERVVADLGTVYSLSYSPTNKQRDGSWRAIRVRLPRHPSAVARGRRGYKAN